jgi:hypothetical protein
VTREYLNSDQLAALTPWSREAIAHMVAKGVLVRGVHYFQPQGSRTHLVFKWTAIVAFIERGAGDGADNGRSLDVEATTAALERLLVRESRAPLRLRYRVPSRGQGARATGLPDTPGDRQRLERLRLLVGAVIRAGQDPTPVLDEHFADHVGPARCRRARQYCPAA